MLSNVSRCLASLAKPSGSAARIVAQQLGYATDAAFTRKDVVNLLDNTADPEVDAGVKAYLKDLFKGKAVEKAEETFELAAQVEKKYVAAQVVEYGIQNIAVPLSADGKDTAPLKRYAAELLNLGSKAGYECPAVEVQKKVAEKATTAESVKDFLGRIRGFTSPDYHASLTEALQQVETEINGPVSMDGSSEGYKKFAKKVEAVAAAAKINAKLLVDAKKAHGDDDASLKLRKEYNLYLKGLVAADLAAEVEVLRTDATSLLDKHLSKTAEQVRKEQEAALSTLQKRIEGAKGAKWAEAYQADLKAVASYDAWRASA